ncbi:MAG: LamG-like jellyroll fold domain-containing protein, partial [Planctomycetota bacterium]
TMGLRSDTGSVAFWMNMSEVVGGINTIWWGGDNTTGGGMGPENEMHIHIETVVTNIWIGGELCFRVLHGPLIHLHSDPEKGDASVPGDPPVNPVLMNDGQWHHVVGTWGDADGNVNLYLDGNLLQQAAYTTPSYPLSNIYLGQMADGGRTYTGLLDDVQIYGGALTEQEIQDVMAGGEALSLAAALPEPANQATEVRRDAVLSWMAGDRADKHNVYFGTVFDDVNEAGIADPRGVLVGENQDKTTYAPAGLLEFSQTYYWRVDEVNAPPDSAVHKGDVWSFTTVNFIVVDDFENYNDSSPNIIYETWIDGWENPENGSTVGHLLPDFLQGEHYAETAIVHGGDQSMPFIFDNSGTATYSEAQRTFNPAQDWTREGVEALSLWFKGYPAYVASFVEAPAGTYTMAATGTDIWANSDEFHFAYKEISGAGAIIAKVESVENSDPWAKAGVMIRDTLEPDSRNVAVLVTPENGVRFQYRNTAGGVTDRAFAEGITAPQWVRLERTTGGLVRAFYSADGSAWTMLNMRVMSMNMPVYIGLAVTSHNVDATCEAKFSNVSFPDTSVDPQWIDQDVGMMSNAAELMYVVLNGSAVVYHEDPGATQIDIWTQWNIGLQGFADLGVDLTNVNTIGIGFGDRTNPQPGGTGTMYFDDIRLYLPR